MTIDDVPFAPIATYRSDGIAKLLVDEGGRVILGDWDGTRCVQYVDISFLPINFVPVGWAECPDELFGAMAWG